MFVLPLHLVYYRIVWWMGHLVGCGRQPQRTVYHGGLLLRRWYNDGKLVAIGSDYIQLVVIRYYLNLEHAR